MSSTLHVGNPQISLSSRDRSKSSATQRLSTSLSQLPSSMAMPVAGLLDWRLVSVGSSLHFQPRWRWLPPRRGLPISDRLRPARFMKMFVPGFGESSPEAKAAKNLQNFFTFIAVRVVLGQLQSYNTEAYAELNEFMSRNSLNDGDNFCRSLMRESPRHQALALRILEVRSAYQMEDFEWDNMKKLAFKMVEESNTKLMREYIMETTHMEDET